MIVEIARADAHLVGDIRGGDVRRAETIEHRQAGFDDPLARASRPLAFRHDGIRAGRLIQRAATIQASSWSSVCDRSRAA